MNFREAELNAAKSLGLLTIREWAAKYGMKNLLTMVDPFTLDGGRGYVEDRPAQLVLNDDGTPFVYCDGPVILSLPGPMCVSNPPGCKHPHAFRRNGAFYLCLKTIEAMSTPRVVFAEAG
jgi:hypothetical protein